MSLSVPQQSFTGGEWAPSLYGRYDLAKYSTAARKILNFIVHPHGGASNRGGTQMIAELKDSTKAGRVIPFSFSTVQEYSLLLENLGMRFIKDGGVITSAAGTGLSLRSGSYIWTVSTVATEYYLTKADGSDPGLLDPGVIYEDALGTPAALAAGTVGTLAESEYGFDDNDSLGFNTIYVRLTGDVDPEVQTTGYIEIFNTAIGSICEIVTPYPEADIPRVYYAPAADTVTFTHPSYPMRKLERYGHAYWQLKTISLGSSMAAPTNLSGLGATDSYVVTAVNDEGEESEASNEETAAPNNLLTWDAVPNAAHYNIYKDDTGGGTYGWIAQAATNSYTEPTATITPDYTLTPPEDDQLFETADNYPGICTTHKQRMFYGRTNNNPNTVWASRIGTFDNFNKSTPRKDDDPLTFKLASNQVNDIRWMEAVKNLSLGTSGAEWTMKIGDGQNDTLVDADVESQWGSAHLKPIGVGKTLMYVENQDAPADTGVVEKQASVRDLIYSLEVDGKVSNDVTLMAPHLFTGYDIVDWCYQRKPNSIVWVVRDDGALIGLTYYREQQVIGWHQHTTDGEIESICCLPGSNEVYMIVKRNIDDDDVRFVERFMARIPSTDPADSWFVDCGLRYEGVAATVISGLDHLEGEEVSILADGFVVTGKTVASGSVTLDTAAEKVLVGLGYTSELETLDFLYQSRNGTIIGYARDITEVILQFEKTMAAWVGPASDSLFEVPFRTNEDYGEAIALYTGLKTVGVNTGDAEASRVYIKNVAPVPITILSITARMEASDV